MFRAKSKVDLDKSVWPLSLSSRSPHHLYLHRLLDHALGAWNPRIPCMNGPKSASRTHTVLSPGFVPGCEYHWYSLAQADSEYIERKGLFASMQIEIGQMAGVSLCMEQYLRLCNRAGMGRIRPDLSLTLSMAPCLIGNFEESENFNLNMCF